jgi:nicotinamide mononucleotide (NMN) deamidase PncC/8-oxo-dGTP pyrophosphatase MutT (NUDIX family)
MDPLFRTVELPVVSPGPLAPLAEEAAAKLKAAKQTVTVFEATTAGLVQAALQAVTGASSYTTCGAITYNPKSATAVLGSLDLVQPYPTDGAAYKISKTAWTRDLARAKRQEVGATWCIAESGACGPTFNLADVSTGFVSVFVSGPIEKGVFAESSHSNREENMWAFTKLALDLLAECVEEASKEAEVPPPTLLAPKEDRYGGVEIDVPEETSGAAVSTFDVELRRGLASWSEVGKKGIWLKVPVSSSSCVAVATRQGFNFHHAKPGYVLLTKWLPETPSTLPMYAFTQIGVGGVVVNSKDEVLMVQEKTSPLPMFQGSWKLPGGLSDPGEDFDETVAREVLEETGITTKVEGVVSLRHSHGFRFGVGDLYVVVKLRAEKEDIVMDTNELSGAEWMSKEKIESLVAASGEPLDGKVSPNNWTMISSALTGPLVNVTELPNSRGGRSTKLYKAS